MATNALSPSAIQVSMDRTQAERLDQYTLWQILGIWALVALPMALLVWVVTPAIIPYSPLLSRHHVLAGDHRRYGMGVCCSPGDHLPRARHAALERHPPADLVANPA